MSHGTQIFSRMSPELDSSVFSFLSGMAIIFILHSQHVRAVDTEPTTINKEYECGECSTNNCIPVTDCFVLCKGCDASSYKYKFIHDSHCGGDSTRKRRQISPPGVTSTILTTIRPTTTTVKNAWICKNCTVAGCKKCIDEEEKPSCEICNDGYLLNNDTHSCSTVPEDSGLSDVAIAGIVIAVLCIVGIAIVIVLFALRRFRGSSDMTGHNERMKLPAFFRKRIKDSPKIAKKHISSCSNDHTELDDLPMAPAPPTNDYSDMQPRYDPLDTKTQNDSQLYQQPTQPGESDLYLNTAAVESQFRQAQGLYENTQQTDRLGVTKANDNTSKHPNLIKPQESIDAYEPLEPAPSVPESHEIYLNDDSELLVQNSNLETDDIYMNEQVDDVYQNT